MISTDDDVRNYDVEAALARSSHRWAPGTSNTSAEGAFLDRTTLAAEVVRLRAELADTIDSLAESDEQIARLQTTIEHLAEAPGFFIT